LDGASTVILCYLHHQGTAGTLWWHKHMAEQPLPDSQGRGLMCILDNNKSGSVMQHWQHGNTFSFLTGTTCICWFRSTESAWVEQD